MRDVLLLMTGIGARIYLSAINGLAVCRSDGEFTIRENLNMCVRKLVRL